MAFQAIWLCFFIGFGLLLQAVKCGSIGYRFISIGKQWNQAQDQPKTTQSQGGLLERVRTTDASNNLNQASTVVGLFISELIHGKEGYTNMNEINASKWNQNQNRTRMESLEKFNQPNTTDATGHFEPVTEYAVTFMNKPVLTQDSNDTWSPEFKVTDGVKMNQNDMSLSQHQNLTTTRPQLGEFDRINKTDASDVFQSVTDIQFQNRTITGSQLPLDKKINVTDSFEEFDPATNNEAQNETDKLSQLVVFHTFNTKQEAEYKSNIQTQYMSKTKSQSVIYDRIITDNASKVLEAWTMSQPPMRTMSQHPMRTSQPQNWTETNPQFEATDRTDTTNLYKQPDLEEKYLFQNLTATVPQLDFFDKTNTTKVIEDFNIKTNNGVKNQWTATYPDIESSEKMNTTDTSEEFGKVITIRDQNETLGRLRLRVLDKVNAMDIYKEFHEVTNNQAKNGTIAESLLRISETITTTNVSEEIESAKSNETQNRTSTAVQLGAYDILNVTYVEPEPNANNNSQTLVVLEPQLLGIDRINTTNISREVEPVINEVVTNKHEKEMYNDITTKAPLLSNSYKVIDTPLLQTENKHRILKDSLLGALGKVNATGVADALEPIINSTGMVSNQSVSEREIQNETATFENEHLKKLVQQDVTKMQVVDSQVTIKQSKLMNENVTRRNNLDTKHTGSIEMVQIEVVKRKKKANIGSSLLKNSRKLGHVKGNTERKAGKVSRNSLSKLPDQNRKNTRLETLDRVNVTNITDEFKSVTNLTGLVVNEILPGQDLSKGTLILGNDIMTHGVQYHSLSPNGTKNADPQRFGALDRINATNIPVQFEPTYNFTAAVENQSISRQQIQYDTFFSGHTVIDVRNISDTSLSQNQTENVTTTDMRLGTSDNATHTPDGSEPETNFTLVVSDQFVPVKKVHNETLRSAEDGDRLNDEEIIKQVTQRGTKKTEESVRMVNNLTKIGNDSKGQVPLHLSVRKKQRNDPDNGTVSGMIKPRIAKSQAFAGGATRAVTKVRKVSTTKGKNPDGPVQLPSVISKKLGNEAKVQIGRKEGDTLINPNLGSRNYLSTTQPPHHTTTKTDPHGVFESVNARNVTDEMKLATNATVVDIEQKMNKDAFISENTTGISENIIDASLSQNRTQNQTTKKLGSGSLHRVNTTDNIEEMQSENNYTGVNIIAQRSAKIGKDDLLSVHTISIRENINDTAMTQNQTQNQTTKESRFGSINIVNKTDDMEDLESRNNITGLDVNAHGSVQLQKGDLTSGHTMINPEEKRYSSVSTNGTQNLTTNEPRFRVLDRVNTTETPQLVEPVTNSTPAASSQTITGKEQISATLNSEKEKLSITATQRVTALQATESGALQANGSVRRVKTLVIKEKDSNGQVTSHTTVRKKQGNKPTKARNSKKQGRRKDDKRVGN